MAPSGRRPSHTRLLLGLIGLVGLALSGCGGKERTERQTSLQVAASPTALHDKGSVYESIVDEFFPRMNAPGMAVAVVKDSQLLWAKGYGSANLATGTAVTTRTPFMLASVTKMVTATALMQLWEKGKFRLDDDINRFLPFRVRNPAFPDVPITFRMLLNHGSSIGDNWDMMPYYFDSGPVPPLGEALRAYFDPETPGFDPSVNFSPWAPGTVMSYSNMGFALAGYLVEKIARQPFHAYCREHIFEPLGMNAGFFMKDFRRQATQPAMPYSLDGATGQFVPYGQYEISDYPDGTLRTDVVSLSRFLMVHMNGGKVPGYPRILRDATVKLMHTPQFTDVAGYWDPWVPWYGLGFFIGWDFGNGLLVDGHEGGDIGVSSYAFYDEASNVGVVFLCNGETWALPEYLLILGDLPGRLTAAAIADHR